MCTRAWFLMTSFANCISFSRSLKSPFTSHRFPPRLHRQPSPFEISEPLHLLMDAWPGTLAQIGGKTIIRDAIFELLLDGPVDFRPAFGLDPVAARLQIFTLGSWSQLPLDELPR